VLDAHTVGDALDALCRQFETLRPRIFQEDGSVNAFVNIFANAEHIRFQNGLRTPVAGGDEIMIIRSVAGG
jgi:molybdopterin converting factor small subunit